MPLGKESSWDPAGALLHSWTPGPGRKAGPPQLPASGSQAAQQTHKEGRQLRPHQAHLDVRWDREGHGPRKARWGSDAQVLVPLQAVTQQAVDCTVVIVGICP